MSKSQRDAQRDKVAWEHVELLCSTLDWRVDFRHALARLRVVANMCGFVRDYAAVCRLAIFMSHPPAVSGPVSRYAFWPESRLVLARCHAMDRFWRRQGVFPLLRYS